MAFRVKDLIVHVLPEDRVIRNIKGCADNTCFLTVDCIDSNECPGRTNLWPFLRDDPNARKALLEYLQQPAKEPESRADVEQVEQRLNAALQELQNIKSKLKD